MNRFSVLALTCASLCAASAAAADTRDDVLAGVARCGVISDDRVWLECVYGAQQPMRARLGLPPAPEMQQRLVPPAATAAPGLQVSARPAPKPAAPPQRRKPGFFQSLVGDPPPYAQAKMKSVSYDRTGAFIMTLENGQEWRQTDVEAGNASFNRAPSDYTVTVTSGSFNSYMLSATGNRRKYRVERVR